MDHHEQNACELMVPSEPMLSSANEATDVSFLTVESENRYFPEKKVKAKKSRVDVSK